MTPFTMQNLIYEWVMIFHDLKKKEPFYLYKVSDVKVTKAFLVFGQKLVQKRGDWYMNVSPVG